MKSYLYALGTLIVLACICQDDIFVLLQPAPANEQKSAATAIVPADTAVVDTNNVGIWPRFARTGQNRGKNYGQKPHCHQQWHSRKKSSAKRFRPLGNRQPERQDVQRAGRRVDRLHRLCGKLFSDFVFLRSQMDDRIRNNRLRWRQKSFAQPAHFQKRSSGLRQTPFAQLCISRYWPIRRKGTFRRGNAGYLSVHLQHRRRQFCQSKRDRPFLRFSKGAERQQILAGMCT